jgi:hypothetical protein
MKLAEMLARSRLVTRENLEKAQIYAAERNMPIARALVKTEAIDGIRLSDFLKRALRINFVDLDRQPVAPPVLAELAGPIAYRLRVFPIALKKGKHEDVLWLGMTDPTDESAKREVEITVGKKVIALLVEEEALSRAIKKYYSGEVDDREDTAIKKIGQAMLRAPDELGGSGDDDLPVVGGALVPGDAVGDGPSAPPSSDEGRPFSKVGKGDRDDATEMMDTDHLAYINSHIKSSKASQSAEAEASAEKPEASIHHMEFSRVEESARSPDAFEPTLNMPVPTDRFPSRDQTSPTADVSEEEADDMAWLRQKATASGEGRPAYDPDQSARQSMSQSQEASAGYDPMGGFDDDDQPRTAVDAKSTAALVAQALKMGPTGGGRSPGATGFGRDAPTVPVTQPYSGEADEGATLARPFNPENVGTIDAKFDEDLGNYVGDLRLDAICLVSKNRRVAEWLSRKLKENARQTFTAASLTAAASLCDNQVIPVVVVVKPENDDDFLVGLTAVEVADHPPRVVVISDNPEFDRITGVAMRVDPLGNMEATLAELLTQLAKEN